MPIYIHTRARIYTKVCANYLQPSAHEKFVIQAEKFVTCETAGFTRISPSSKDG